MFGVSRREEIRRYRQMWYQWSRPGLDGNDPRTIKRRGNAVRAVGRAGRRAQVPVPHALRDL